MAETRLPEHISAVLPKAAHVFTISPAERGFEVAVFWRGHLVEKRTVTTRAEAHRITARLVREGATGFVEGAA